MIAALGASSFRHLAEQCWSTSNPVREGAARMHAHSRSFRLTAAVAVSALLAAQALPWPVLAQGAPPPQPGVQDQQGGDPPERVGRLARVSGTVSFHTQDDDQWSPATANYPVYAGNAFWTEPNAQA